MIGGHRSCQHILLFSTFYLFAVLIIPQPATCQADDSQGNAVSSDDAMSGLETALEELRGKFKKDGKQEFIPLLEIGEIRVAIISALKSYEARLKDETEDDRKSRKYFEDVIKPYYTRIAQTERWSPNTEFTCFYRMTDANNQTYRGLGLRLEISTPGELFDGFALPIVDVWYGRFK